jgi:beta-glucosidase
MRALAFFDEVQNAWVAEAGDFEVLVGASSADVRGRSSFALAGTWREAVGTTRPQYGK